MKKIITILVCIVTLVSCGLSEDCVKNSGSKESREFDLGTFERVKVNKGIGLVVKQGPEYNVRIEAGKNIFEELEVKLVGDMLVVEDLSTCNWTRDYGEITVFVTAPYLIELHSKTEQKISSDGVLTYPILRLFSIDDETTAGTGDFHIQVDNGQLVIESNHLSNFYISGHCNQMLLNFYFGDGRFFGENLQAETINVFQRGSNDMFVYPIQSITGTIYSVGNVILKNNPPLIDVEEVFRGRLIYN
jgi:hypothetical protein